MLDTDIPNKQFLCLQDVFETSSTSRRLQDMSSRRLEDVFSVTIFRLPRRLQDILKMSWKTKNCYAEDVLKMSGLLLLLDALKADFVYI